MWPDMKILYISGYRGFMDYRSIAPKPFTDEVLLGKLREVVSADECEHVSA